MLHHEGGKLTVQVAEQNHVAFAHLVEHAHQVSLAIGGTLGGLHGRDVRDVAVVADGIVVDEIAHVFDEAIISDGHVAKGGIVDASMLHESLAHLHILVEGTDIYLAIEHHAVHEVWLEIFCNINGCPVFCPTVVALEHLDFLGGQRSVVIHC